MDRRTATRVMPVGDSITAGEHYGYPHLSRRTGYRRELYRMLTRSGYRVDFVGSQEHGKRPEDDPDWFDWGNEAYPGWEIDAIAERLEAALPVYDPDILLIHVGTNGSNWDEKPRQVMDMLDMTNAYSARNGHPIVVLLCMIVRRFCLEESDPTPRFNAEVAEMLTLRTGDTIRIVPVDMENRAGLDYSDNPPDPAAVPPYEGGDMWGRDYRNVPYDAFHPNDKGNAKIAAKFYDELVQVLDRRKLRPALRR